MNGGGIYDGDIMWIRLQRMRIERQLRRMHRDNRTAFLRGMPVAVCCQDIGIVHCGGCPDIPWELLTKYSCDPEHGDTPQGARSEQCIRWYNNVT